MTCQKQSLYSGLLEKKMKLKRLIQMTMLKIFGAAGFGKVLVSADQSTAYGIFCEKVYGRNLSQCNMIDEDQLQKLVAVLDLNTSSSVLDLGCGIGRISEYISSVSNCRVTGLDFAKKAIESAKVRTSTKNSLLHFLVGNLNSLPEPFENFDRIVAMDTLYFVDDLQKTMGWVAEHLKKDGKFAAFYTHKKSPENENPISAENTDLAMALTKAGFKFQTWNFTENEKRIWERSFKVAEELKEKFRSEKKLDLYKGRIQESRQNLEWAQKGLTSRWLYLATK
jgi:cyclopropane fatty-acyl-phospholipid synthase-like methyltransferase